MDLLKSEAVEKLKKLKVILQKKIQKIENEITIITRTIRTLEPSEKETNKSCEIERVKGWSSSAAGDPTDPHDDIRRNFG